MRDRLLAWERWLNVDAMARNQVVKMTTHDRRKEGKVPEQSRGEETQLETQSDARWTLTLARRVTKTDA